MRLHIVSKGNSLTLISSLPFHSPISCADGKTRLTKAKTSGRVIPFSTNCNVSVLSEGRQVYGLSIPSWHGDVTFVKDGEEVVRIGLHPERGNIAIRNSIFREGKEAWGYQWVEATYPKFINREYHLSYKFYFTDSEIVISSMDVVIYRIAYEKLSNSGNIDINGVKFHIGTEGEAAVQLYFTVECLGIIMFLVNLLVCCG